MPYADKLADEEYARWQPNQTVLNCLEDVRIRSGIARQDFRVLDWGCGRGQYVLLLREHGYSAFGADPSAAAIARGMEFMQRRGQPHAELVKLVHRDGRTDFPSDFFHFIFSFYVLEHVRDLETMARELWRITRPAGVGIHIGPGRWRPIEGHLSMPMVHWLPKGESRRVLIALCVALGIEPRWMDATRAHKTKTYFDFSVDHTFYRSYPEIRAVFLRHHFAVTPRSLRLRFPRLTAAAQRAGANRLARGLERFVMELGTTELFLEKRDAPSQCAAAVGEQAGGGLS